jgi:hypothetical protein
MGVSARAIEVIFLRRPAARCDGMGIGCRGVVHEPVEVLPRISERFSTLSTRFLPRLD